MSIIAIALVVTSAVIHALWNLSSKQRKPSAAFFLLTCFSGFVLLLPLLLAHQESFIRHIPGPVWTYLALTGFFLAVYYISLAGAYRAGDMSVAYPLARSFPAIVVTIVTVIMGRGDRLTTQCIIGIFFVVTGCFLVPRRRFADFSMSDYWNSTCGWALLAAMGTAGYSMVDDEALRLLRNSANLDLSIIRTTLLYACMEFMSAFLWIGMFVAIFSRDRSSFGRVIRTGKRQAVLTGVAIVTCYVLVLISLAFVKNVSYVVGFRQLSILLGTVFAVLFLNEPPLKPKLLGVIVIFAGLIIIAFG